MIELLKKKAEFTNKDGKTVKTTNFYLKCGDTLVAIEPKYFKQKDGSNDNGYSGRVAVLKSYAAELPDKD